MSDQEGGLQQAFTLTEVMFVVVIIGMLASLMLPFFMHSREESFQTMCIENLRILRDSKTMWSLADDPERGQEPTAADLEKYIHQDIERLVCPLDPDKTFESSYRLNDMDSLPECLIAPGEHVLPE